MAPWTTSESTNEVMAALIGALGNMPEITKDKSANIGTKGGGAYGYKYADLASVLAAIRPVLSARKLALVQNASTIQDDMVAISTTIIHESGQFIAFAPLMLPAGRTAQETGSAITYGRRYHLLTCLGLAAEDDDGASAAPRRQRTTPQPATPSAPTPAARTEEEDVIRRLVDALPTMERSKVRALFRSEFGALSDLPVERHAEALAWVRSQITTD